MVFRKPLEKSLINLIGSQIAPAMGEHGILVKQVLMGSFADHQFYSMYNRCCSEILHNGMFLINPALKLFQCKAVLQLRYGVQNWGRRITWTENWNPTKTSFKREFQFCPKALMGAEFELPSTSYTRCHAYTLENVKELHDYFLCRQCLMIMQKDAVQEACYNILHCYSIADDTQGVPTADTNIQD